MKRIVLAMLLLLLAGGAVGTLHVKAGRAQQRLTADQHQIQTRLQRLAEIEITRTTLTEQVRALKGELRTSSPDAAIESAWVSLLATNDLAGLTPATREQLFSELGLDWRNSGEWLLVSKTTLAGIRMAAVHGTNLTDSTCGVLAITPEERRQVDAALARAQGAYVDWARSNVRREGPSGETLARYVLPGDATFAEGLTNTLWRAFTAALGQERAALLDHYTADWVRSETGSLGAATNCLTLFGKVDAAGATQLWFKVEQRGAFGMSAQGPSPILPVAYFPGQFRAVFPGGWPEVTRREGFELPVGFVDRPPVDTRTRIQAVFPEAAR